MITKEDIEEKAAQVEKYLETHDTDRLETYAEWEKGYYVSDSKPYLMVRPVVRLLQERGYRVESERRHGITEYTIYSKILS